MRAVKILSLKNQSVIADECIVADRFFARLRGLIGTSRLEPGEGLLLSPCNDIHMWLMSIPIDVVFVRPLPEGETDAWAGATHVVCSVREKLRPWKLLPVRDASARQTIELPAGTIRRCEIREGDGICIS